MYLFKDVTFHVLQVYLYGKQTKAISYNDFVNKELVLFSNADNERSIPSLCDGRSINPNPSDFLLRSIRSRPKLTIMQETNDTFFIL